MRICRVNLWQNYVSLAYFSNFLTYKLGSKMSAYSSSLAYVPKFTEHAAMSMVL